MRSERGGGIKKRVGLLESSTISRGSRVTIASLDSHSCMMQPLTDDAKRAIIGKYVAKGTHIPPPTSFHKHRL